jgi:CheY-like chemotaxis protein
MGELLDGRPNARKPAIARGTTGVTGGSPRRRILLVEDDEDTRQLLAVALEAQSYEVSQAGDAEEGLKALGRGHFDMILTDYDLPGKTGAAMLREANARRLVDGAATLVVTAHPDPEGVKETTLVRKPLDLEKFLHQVRRIFDSMPMAAAPVRFVPRGPPRARGARGRRRPRGADSVHQSRLAALAQGATQHGEVAAGVPRRRDRLRGARPPRASPSARSGTTWSSLPPW